ncbi:MAG: type II CAAX endopeptidase family protein [Actinomycetes bacterium]
MSVDASRSPRVRPTVPVATVAFVIYVVIFIGLMKLSGFAYTDIFNTTEGALRGAVLPLAAGSLWLIVFIAVARWDFVFRDPRKLSMGFWLWLAPILMLITLALQFIAVTWSSFDIGHLLAIVAAAILVGFAEETLFRGIILRALRNGDRSEGMAVLFSSLWFGLFHLTNLIVGAGATVIFQVVVATLAGVGLYLARRGTGLLIAGMVLHGLWDLSSFLVGVHADDTLKLIGPFVGYAAYAACLAALIIILRRDRTTHMLATDEVPAVVRQP